MSIFGKIKDAIFGQRPRRRASARRSRPEWTAAAAQLDTSRTAAPPPDPTAAAGRCRAGADRHAAAKGNPDLNYKTSIVDLMKLLGLDSSLDNRKELATELGYTGDKDGSAEMNIWLHKEVMRQLAANGGKVPASMTD